MQQNTDSRRLQGHGQLTLKDTPDVIRVQLVSIVAEAGLHVLAVDETTSIGEVTICALAACDCWEKITKRGGVIIIIINNNNRIQRRNSRLFTIFSLRREPSPTRALKWPGRKCANHVQHIECLSRATCRVTCHVVRREAHLLNLTELKSHLFEVYFIGWTIDGWKREGIQSTRRIPLVTSFRKCHMLKPDDSSPERDRTHTIALVTG